MNLKKIQKRKIYFPNNLFLLVFSISFLCTMYNVSIHTLNCYMQTQENRDLWLAIDKNKEVLDSW